MKKQRDLNFKPGDEYLYSNTGYMLMVNIIEKLTKEKVPNWMKKSIFTSLGMTNTYVEDNYNRIVPNNATSYYGNGNNKFERAVEYWGYVGSGNMHSTTDDLLKWLTNFYNPQSGWEASFKTLQTLDKLNNGVENNYAYGLIIDEINGHKRIQHSGGIGGFSAVICVYPVDKLNIVVLTNFHSSSGRKANQISEILLKNKNIENTSDRENNKPVKTVKLTNDQLKKYEASFWNDKDNYARKIYIKNDTLRYFRSENSESSIIPIAKNEFQMLGVSVVLKVKFKTDGKRKTMIVSIDNEAPIIFDGFEPNVPTKGELASYTGKFYSPELETTYSLSLKDDTLICHHMRHADFKMKVLKKDVLEGRWPLSIAKYSRDKNGKVSGIFVPSTISST